MSQNKYPQKILIVEDEKAMLNALVDNLHAAGFGNVLQAENGENGLAMAQSENPDLIILDIVMPKMDGMTMLQKLREQPAGRETKIILLTNFSPDDAIMKGVASDEPSYYLIKTEHSIDEIMQKVKDALAIDSPSPQAS